MYFKRIALSLCFLTLQAVQAEVVLQADFDSADQLITTGGKGQLVAYSTNNVSIEKQNPLAPQSNGFLRVDARADSKPGNAGGIKITPESPAQSFAAMSTLKDGKMQLNGAVDFFFRASGPLDKGMNVIRAFDVNNNAKGGLRLIYLSRDGKPRLELLTSKKNEALVRSNGKKNRAVVLEAGIILEPQTVYHLAIGFVTDSKGTVTVTMYAAEGTGEMNSEDALATTRFTINGDLLKTGFSDQTFLLGKIGQFGTPTLHDFDRFRLYNQLPETFEALK